MFCSDPKHLTGLYPKLLNERKPINNLSKISYTIQGHEQRMEILTCHINTCGSYTYSLRHSYTGIPK